MSTSGNTRRILIFLLTVAGVVTIVGGPVSADFTFGEPVNLKSIIPVIDVATDGIDCFSYDGLEMYSTTYVGPSVGAGNWNLRVLRRASIDEDWGPPENLGPSINTIYVDADTSISADGLTLYFNSSRPEGYGSSDIWMTTRATRDTAWGPAVNLGLKVNTSGSEAFPWISADGLELYFCSTRPGGYGSADIYVAKRATPNDPWNSAVNLGPTVNSAYTEGPVSLSPDGLLLVFYDRYVNAAMHRPGGYGGFDIWMSRRASSSAPWQTPVNLGPRINTAVDEEFPRISPDGRVLYFGSGSSDPTTWVYYQASIIPVVDFDGDGKVDANDQAILKAHGGQNDPRCDIGPFPWGDGVVDAKDQAILAGYMGQEVNDPTLIAHWALDQREGMLAKDSAGFNDALVLGNASWRPDGKIAGALAFDGKDDVARSLSSSVLNPAIGSFSVIAWVKGGAANRVIVSQLGGADWLYLNQFGMLTTDLKSSGRDPESLTSSAYVLDDQWHRVALVWDGMNRALHMDGIEVAKDTQPSLVGSNGNLQIGCGKSATPTTFWTGLIDDVRIYSRAVAP